MELLAKKQVSKVGYRLHELNLQGIIFSRSISWFRLHKSARVQSLKVDLKGFLSRIYKQIAICEFMRRPVNQFGIQF